MTEKNKKIVSFVVVFLIIYLFIIVIFVLFQYRKNNKISVLSQNKEKILTVEEYHNKQLNKIIDFESTFDDSKSIELYLNEENIIKVFYYANALTRQHDFVGSDRASSTSKAITIYRMISKSNLPNKYKVYALNEMYSAFIQSGSNIDVLKDVFSDKEIKDKISYFKLDKDEKKLTSKDRLFLYQNLLADKEFESVLLIPTKIAIARIAMQDYINQLFFRTSLGKNINNDTSNKEVLRIKKDFSEKVIKDYEKYKFAESNTIKPYIYSNLESKYLMAWSLNRAAIYTGSSSLVEESYKIFDESILMIEDLKKNSNDFWGLSIITKIFYASSVLGSNKDAYIDVKIEENRKRSLLILSELSSDDFMTNSNYSGIRSYLTNMRNSNFDWITTLILLAKYDEALRNNLKSLGWEI